MIQGLLVSRMRTSLSHGCGLPCRTDAVFVVTQIQTRGCIFLPYGDGLSCLAGAAFVSHGNLDFLVELSELLRRVNYEGL